MINGDTIMHVIGGLALFLFGINLMSDSLKQASGSKLKMIIEKTTSTPLKGILVGVLLTVIIQSSSATTALMIGLLRADLMTLSQSVGVIMGANIGTTVTAFIIGLPIAKYGLWMIALGFVLFFVKKRRIHHLGGVFMGLGLLFLGLETMGGGLKPLAATPTAERMFAMFSENWFLGSVFGTLFTTLVQSSSAAIGILEELYALNANNIASITLGGAIPILLGANIGTTITALIASIGGNKESKQASFIHVLFNVTGAVFFLLLLTPYTRLISWIERTYLTAFSKLSIAVAHAVVNIVMTIVLFPFIKQMVWLARRVIRSEAETFIDEMNLDERLLEESSLLALEATQKTIVEMAKYTQSFLSLSRQYSFKEDATILKSGYEIEEKTRYL